MRSRLAMAVLAAAFPISAAAQADFRSTVERALIPCSVVDSHGAPVADLSANDFLVTDNGIRRIVEHAWTAADLPLTLGILIDASDSQDDLLAEHRQTALAILERLLRPGDRAFVISIGVHVLLWSDLTGDLAEIRARVAAQPTAPFGLPCPVTSCGASPLWNTVYQAARDKLAGLAGNKALLILSDGFDTGSPHTWREASLEAQKAGAAVYAVAYPSSSGAAYAPDLNRVTAESGGAFFAAPQGDYGPILSRLDADLRRGYILSFRPESTSGKLRHDVEVQITRPGLTVRARKTYYQPQ